MKKLIINYKDIEFFIDYLRIDNKENHNCSNVDYDYNCTLKIVSKTKLTDYEKEIISRYIKEVVNEGSNK